MAIVHFAWQLEVEPFVEQVHAVGGGSEAVDERGLRRAAEGVVTSDLGGSARAYLSAVAAVGEDGRSIFDDAEDDPDGEVSTSECYQVLMADHLRWAPSIRDPRLLRAGLVASGCPPANIDQVIAGERLGDFAVRHHDRDLAHLISGAGIVTDGILERDDRLRLADVLESNVPWFHDPPEDFVAEQNAVWRRMDDSFRSLLFNSCCDAIAMLRFEIDTPRALRLFEAW